MPQLPASEYRRYFLSETTRLAQTQPEQLGMEIPHLDDWTVRTVLEHTATVFQFVSLAMSTGPDDKPDVSTLPAAPKDSSVIGWFEESAQLAAQAIDDVDLSSMRPTWTGPQPASWYVRRLAHEVSVHHWDVQTATTTPDGIEADLAVDGVDELLEIYAPRRMDFDVLAGNGETIHLHATDHGQGEWLITLKEDHIEWEHSHTKADVAARGSASDLLLLLWGRRSHAELEIFGDDSILSRWKSAASF